MEVLDEARTLDGSGSPLVFALGDGRPIFDRRLLRKLEIRAVPYGFRSSFHDWAAEETDHPREVIEAALARICGCRVGFDVALRSSDVPRTRRLMRSQLRVDPSC